MRLQSLGYHCSIHQLMLHAKYVAIDDVLTHWWMEIVSYIRAHAQPLHH